MAGKHGSLTERFWRGVEIAPSGCWLWRGRATGGYGHIGLGGRHGGSTVVHRVSWEIHNGPIPDGAMVLHTCDVKPCCNPGHLYLGDAKQNAKDASERGQIVKGDGHWMRRDPEHLARFMAAREQRRQAVNFYGKGTARAKAHADLMRNARYHYLAGAT